MDRAHPARAASGGVVANQGRSAATITTSSMTRGELAKPHSGTSVFVSAATLRDQRSLPLPASSAFKSPVAPNE